MNVRTYAALRGAEDVSAALFLFRNGSKPLERRRLPLDRDARLPRLRDIDLPQQQLPGDWCRPDDHGVRVVRRPNPCSHSPVRHLDGNAFVAIADLDAHGPLARRAIGEIEA